MVIENLYHSICYPNIDIDITVDNISRKLDISAESLRRKLLEVIRIAKDNQKNTSLKVG